MPPVRHISYYRQSSYYYYVLDADKYCETDNDITWVRDEAIKIRYGKDGMEAMPSISVTTMMKSTVDKYPNTAALSKYIMKSDRSNHEVTPRHMSGVVITYPCTLYKLRCYASHCWYHRFMIERNHQFL